MILGDELTPLSQLSAAFLGAKTPLHLQFAYYESALAVEFLVRAVRPARPEGRARRPGRGHADQRGAAATDENDARSVRPRVSRSSPGSGPQSVAPGATWEEPDLPADADSERRRGLAREASQELPGLAAPGGAAGGRGEMAARPRKSWNDSRHSIRSTSGRRTPTCCWPPSTGRLSDPAAERKVLEELAARDGDASAGLPAADGAGRGGRRLARPWPQNARRLLAVNPLIPAPHRQLARAAEQLGERDEAVDRLPRPGAARRHRPGRGPLPPGASCCSQAGKRDEARREVLKSLEEAPRFLDAHRLLLELVEPPTAPRRPPTVRPRVPRAQPP